MPVSFAAITWDVDPVAFEILGRGIRWYGIFYALSFYVGFLVLDRIFRWEAKPEADRDKLAVSTIVGAIVGARLAHVFFYSAADSIYWSEPWRILFIWEGGLASHGGIIGIAISTYLYSRKRPSQPMLWVGDRLMVAIGFSSVMIRLGNMMNSEIVGIPTEASWGFYFVRHLDPAISAVPRHPTGFYEAGAYLIIWIVMLVTYYKLRERTPRGFLVGLYLTLLFTARFLIEFLKIPQEDYTPLIPGLTTGQLLSMPAIALGLFYFSRGVKKLRSKPTKSAANVSS